LVALFIPVYWFYESGIPALGTEGRLAAEADAQYVTDVARGYELYIANCAECHGEEGQGGIGPRLNDQAKLYNVLTPAGDPGSGHLNPNYLDNVLTVGGRYICGDPDSLMASWREPNGPLNYRQIEELIVWLNASNDIIFEPHGESHGEDEEGEGEPEVVAGWRDPSWEPGPEDTPVPACWKAPEGLTAAGGTGTTVTTPTDGGAVAAVAGGTPEEPRVIQLEATASLDFTDPDGTVVPEIAVVPGETIVFEIDNVADFDHNFWIGPESEVSVPNNETVVGHPTWQSGVQTVEWTVPPAEDLAGLQFACTVPGHYAAGMFGNFVIAEGGGEAAPAEGDATEPAEAETDATEPADDGAEAAAAGGTPEEPRVIRIQANAALQFLDESGAVLTSIDAVPGETIEFQIENTAGFEHNFFIGTAEELQVPYGETDVGIPTWTSGVEIYTWTVPESGAEGLQFACTVPGHYTPMHGDIVISG
ncbi:MAG: c-type cytochrome, partial [Chloroflexota bacterium]